MPVLFLLKGPKMGFRPAAATRCPDKREIWHVPNFTFIGAEMWEYSSQNCKKIREDWREATDLGHPPYA